MTGNACFPWGAVLNKVNNVSRCGIAHVQMLCTLVLPPPAPPRIADCSRAIQQRQGGENYRTHAGEGQDPRGIIFNGETLITLELVWKVTEKQKLAQPNCCQKPPGLHLALGTINKRGSSTHSLLGSRLPVLTHFSHLIPSWLLSFQLPVLLVILSCYNCAQWQGPFTSGIDFFKP